MISNINLLDMGVGAKDLLYNCEFLDCKNIIVFLVKSLNFNTNNSLYKFSY